MFELTITMSLIQQPSQRLEINLKNNETLFLGYPIPLMAANINQIQRPGETNFEQSLSFQNRSCCL